MNLGDHVMNYAEHRKREHEHRVQLWNSLTLERQQAAIADREKWLWQNLFHVIQVRHVEQCPKCTGHAVQISAWPAGRHCACGLILIFDRWLPGGLERVFTKPYQFETKWAVRIGVDSVEHWNYSDWDFLAEIGSLDVKYFTWSNVFAEWLADNGTAEQTRTFFECRNSAPPTGYEWTTACA